MLKLHKGYGPFEVAFSDSRFNLGFPACKYTIHGVWVPKGKYEIKYNGDKYNLFFPNLYICSTFSNSEMLDCYAIATKHKIHSLTQRCGAFIFYNTDYDICMPFKKFRGEKLRDQARRFALNYMSSEFTDSTGDYGYDNGDTIRAPRLDDSVKNYIHSLEAAKHY